MSYIDEALYGTTERRQKQLETNVKLLNDNYSIQTLIKLVEDENEYSVKENRYNDFKKKYFEFLD